MYEQLRDGDTVIFWRIDWLERTAWELIRLMAELSERKIRFVSVTEGIDTSTAMGKLWFSMNVITAKNQRTIQMERSGTGLVAVRALGWIGVGQKGYPPKASER